MNIFNSQFILSEKRHKWIDYDKGISIILVAYGHSIVITQSSGADLASYPLLYNIGLFLYGFRMPLFFIISGVFVAGSLMKKGLKGYINGRANNILYPFIIWGFIEVTLILATLYLKHQPARPTAYAWLFLDPRRVGTGHFWYLDVLFAIGVIYAFVALKLKINPIVQLIAGLVLYAVSGYIHVHHVQALVITDIFEYYFFFSLGAFLSGVLLDKKNVDAYASWKFLVPLLAIFAVVQYYVFNINLHQGKGELSFVEHNYPTVYLIQALIGCALSINISLLLQKYDRVKFIRIVGYYSLFIYVMQIIVMMVTAVVMMHFMNIQNVPLLLFSIWIIGTLLPVAIYNTCLRFNMWRLFAFKKPVKEIKALRKRPGDLPEPEVALGN